RDAQGVTVSEQQHCRIAVAVAPEALGRSREPLHLGRCEILTAAALRIPGLAGRVGPYLAPTFPKTSLGAGELDRDNTRGLLLLLARPPRKRSIFGSVGGRGRRRSGVLHSWNGPAVDHDGALALLFAHGVACSLGMQRSVRTPSPINSTCTRCPGLN